MPNITPLLNGIRVTIPVSKADYNKVHRGPDWSATVRDVKSGIRYKLTPASCGLGRCHCDAVAYPFKEE